MSLFRSEEHAERWIAARRYEHGKVVPLEQVWRLALTWYTDPRAPSWRPRTAAESQAVLESAGLTGDFWRLS